MKKESSLRVYLLVGYVAKRVVDPKEIPVSSGRGWGEDGSIPGESHMRAKETTQKPAAHWTNVRYTGSVRCWMASLTQRAWVWVNSGSGDGQGSLACCSLRGCKELDMTERLNWTELNMERAQNPWKKWKFCCKIESRDWESKDWLSCGKLSSQQGSGPEFSLGWGWVGF